MGEHKRTYKECLEKHMKRVSECLVETERLKIKAAKEKIHKSYYTRWVRESNGFFKRLVMVAHRYQQLLEREKSAQSAPEQKSA